MNSIRRSELDQVFLQIPPDLRRPVLRDITTKKLARESWIDEDGDGCGCLFLVAACAVTKKGLPEVLSFSEDDTKEAIAWFLHIPITSVSAGIQVWDGMSQVKRNEFLERMRQELWRMDYDILVGAPH